MKTLTEHEKRILDLVQRHPEIVNDKKIRRKVASEIGVTEKTLRNRIADLKRYGLVSPFPSAPAWGAGGTVLFDQESSLVIWFQVLLKRWKLILGNLVWVTLVAAGISLVMPKAFRSTALIMPPSTQPELGVLGAISELPLGGLNLGVGDNESLTFLAILNSRTVMENVIRRFDLVDFYDADNMEEAVEALRNNVAFEIEDEGTISISAIVSTEWFPDEVEEDQVKLLSADIANYLVSNLDVVNKRLKTEKASFQRQFIEKRYNQNIEEMKEAEERLKSFQETYNMIALPEQMEAAIEAAAAIKAQILADEVKLNVMAEMLSDVHPDVEMVRREIKELQSQLEQMEKGSSGRDLFPGFSEVPDLGIQLARLERDVEIQNTLFTFLTQQYEEAKIKEAKDTPTVQVLDSAVRPERKAKPKRAIFVFFYGFLSLLLTSVYVMFKPSPVAPSKISSR
ncbi:MAG: GumC family protein [Fidelibacterota bacterium]